MARCERCGKGPQFGQNRPFSLKATKRQFRANVHKTTIYQDGRKRTAHLCTRCLRTLAKTG
jgi:large subunit ribosomal protein L28